MSTPCRLGAWFAAGRTHFNVWAPRAERVEVVVEPGPRGPARSVPLVRDEHGYFTGSSAEVGPGDRYRYRLDDADSWPDPASRFQPEGVHGPSAVIDPTRFAWTDAAWAGPDRDRMVIYELHVGSFTPQGTYTGVADHLTDLVELGVTVIELMPLNACDGRWNWGYDGAALFAPSHHHGTPDELRMLIDRAHALGLAVILDVVYNHFGPAGNYTGRFSADYVRSDHITAWGPAINLGGPGAANVTTFFLANAWHWVDEYHFDGFRLDATHAFVDDGPHPFLAEFTRQIRDATPRNLVVIAEDHRNLRTILDPRSDGGWGLDGVWADDFHHIIRRHLTGDRDGVYQDFAGTVAELATTINRGWLKTGEYSNYRQRHRGTDPAGLAPERFVFCLQNHDRVGNRGRGDRLHHAVDPATYRAATAALLLAPETPMLFMGQEWAASTPFHYFTDHAPELGETIVAGRAREFRRYDDFNTPARLAAIPNPQAESTFRRGQLDWTERAQTPHAAVLRLYRAGCAYRRSDPSFADRTIRVEPIEPDALGWTFGSSGRYGVVNLRGSARFDLPDHLSRKGPPQVVFATESPDFATDPVPIRLEQAGAGWQVQFERPGAIIVGPGRPDPADSAPTR